MNDDDRGISKLKRVALVQTSQQYRDPCFQLALNCSVPVALSAALVSESQLAGFRLPSRPWHSAFADPKITVPPQNWNSATPR
jgi:hypothetical protein